MHLDDMPLAGLRAIEFTHMVMGPSAGLILADLGAEVIRVEPIGGDRTRALLGSGAGYFPMYNRNKRSICLDLKKSEGVAIARRLVGNADILIENFSPGTLNRLGLGYDVFKRDHPELIYCSAKGFLSGPYEDRVALDEVAQMMGGLAYMTGAPGKPMRVGASIIDVTGGMFGVIGILASLQQRQRTGIGAHIKCSLYETTAFLVGQHMAQMAVTGVAAAPMPARLSAWAIYDVFDAQDGEQLFIGVVSDAQWRAFCAVFGLDEFANDASLATNNDRVMARDRFLPRIRALIASRRRDDVLRQLRSISVPAATVMRPEDLFDDEHLNSAQGLVELTLNDGGRVRLPALPLEVDGDRFGVRRDLAAAGADSRAVLTEMGFDAAQIDAMIEGGAVA